MANELDVLRAYIRDQIGFHGHVDAHADLLEERILDSFNIVELAMFVQEQFQVELETEDLVRANLNTLAHIAALIERRRASQRQ
jgi:acyl carrier protein